MREWGPTGDNTDAVSVKESEGEASLFTGDHVCVQCVFCNKWRHLDSAVHDTDDLTSSQSKYTCPSTVCKDTREPIGLSCEEPEQNYAPPNPEDPYASEPYDTIKQAVECFVIRTVEHPTMSLDPAGYPKGEIYRVWMKPVVEEFMTDLYHEYHEYIGHEYSYHEYLGYIGRIYPEGSVPPC